MIIKPLLLLKDFQPYSPTTFDSASWRRGRVKGILWMTEREWEKAMVVTPSLVSREREHSPLRAQMPRNSATELSTTAFFGVILTGKGDIPEVVDQLKPLEDLHFHLNHENGNGRERLETRPPHPSGV